MTRTLPRILTTLLLLATLVTSGLAQSPVLDGDESQDVDDSAPVARVARLSFVEGDVSFLRAGVTEWAPVVENLPLLAGDQIYTGNGSRAEIQLARGNYIRLPENSELTISILSDSGAQFELTEGIAIIRVERISNTFRRFEVDTPNTAVLVQRDGIYRIEVRGEKSSALIVSRGEAEVSTDEGTFRVREGHRMSVETATGGRIELVANAAGDEWDQWSHDRDVTIASDGADVSPDYVTNYETTYNDFYGASDLSSYGTWTNYSSYGQCWIPRVGADWAPYRFGQWLWIPAAGWTWLASEPWGWAPYHYGRWAFLTGLGWAWIPGFGSAYRGYGYRDYHWRPALVYFFNSPTPRGNYIGWYPLAPGQRWRRHRADDRAQYPFPGNGRRRSDDRDRPQLHHGVSILPADGFARGNRSGVRPGAPARELSDLISKDARAGLPEMKVLPVSAAPELAEGDRRKSRRLAVPATEIIKRPVVTSNASDSSAPFVGQRERRIILPRNPDADVQVPSKKERAAERKSRTAGTDFSDAASGDGPSNQKTRLALPIPTEKTDGDRSARERKRNREGDATVDNTTRRTENDNNVDKAERRRARKEQSLDSTSGSVNQGGNSQHDNENRRDKRARGEDPTSNQDAKPKFRIEEPRSQDRGAGKAEGRQERSNSENQTRQERREQRQERQQQESRKKP
jgi:hypothetical protein